MRRIRITVVGFCVLLLGYRVYAMTLVPWIEPREKTTAQAPDEKRSVVDFATEERTNFREFLPENAWERAADTSILESDQGALIFMNHESLEDGTVKLWPLTLVYYAQEETKKSTDVDQADVDPTDEDIGGGDKGTEVAESMERSKTPIFIQAPEGAILETDQAINLARLDVGNPVSARLLGEITIHRPNAAAKGEEDDSLWLVTRNLKVSQTQIITPQPVEFRLGPHWGYGEDLEIELTIPSKRRDKKAAFGRIKNLTLHRLERVMLVTDDGFLRRAGIRTDVTGGDDSTRGDEETGGDVHAAARLRIAERRSDSEDEPPKKKTPIEIRSSGPFEFDLATWRATLTGDVRVTRIEEPFHDTVQCHRLTVLLNEPADDDTSLSFNKMIAEGLPNVPVQLSIPSQEVAGRGHRLTCYYEDRRILFEDQKGAWFRHRTTEIEVPVLDYYLHPDNPRRLGEFDGKGPGVMRGVAEVEEKQTPLLLSWLNSIQVRPTETPDMRVISIFGKAHINVEDTGTFDARELHLFVSEQPRLEVKNRWRIVPNQLYATGGVSVDSPRLTGNVNDMRVWFVPEEDSLPDPLTDSILPPPRDADDDMPDKPKSLLDDDFDSPPMHVEGARLHARVMQGEKPRIDDVRVFGKVIATKPLGPDRKPFVVRGENVQISQIQTTDVQVRVSGAARIMADGVEIHGERVFVSGLKNELWIDGPGDLFAPPRRPTPQRPLQAGELVHATWHESLKFDGETATIRDQVVVVGESRVEKTNDIARFSGNADQVRMKLDRRISFLDPPERDEAKDIVIKSVRFDGPASGRNTTVDPFNVQISQDEMNVRDLEVWPETGDVSGGAGWLRTLRYGESFRQTAGDKKSDLMHVEVHFADSIRGNLENLDITFAGDVHTIAGPIQHWRQRLDPNVPDGLGEDGIEIFSQKLRGVEFAMNQKESYLELIADGNVKVHNIQFSAFADRLTYDNSKDLITLKGIGPGRLARVESLFRGVPHQGKGRELQIWPKRKHVEWEEIQRIEFGGRPRNSK
jgi:hypothetical protein